MCKKIFCTFVATKVPKTPAQICSASQAPRAQMPRRLLLLNVCRIFALHSLPLTSTLYRLPVGSYAVLFRTKPKPSVSLNKQICTYMWEVSRRGSGKPDSSICHFDGIPKTVKMTCLQWRFATEPSLLLSGEFLVLLFRDKSTNEKAHRSVPFCQYAFVRKIPDWTL